MPLHNWIKCTEGDLRYSRKKVEKDTEETEQDNESWETIYDEYIEKYGLSELYKKVLELMRKKALLECEYVITGDQFKVTQIAVLEEKLKSSLNNNGKGMSIEQSLIHLSKWLGYPINTYKTTVVEYFNILEQYGKGN